MRSLCVALAAVLSSTALAAPPRAAPAASGKSAAASPAKPSSERPAPATPPGWVPLIAPQSGFRMALPSKPEEKTSQQQTAVGVAQTTTWSISQGDTHLVVGATQFPPGSVGKTSPGKVLEDTRDGALANAHSSTVSEKAIQVAGPKGEQLPGREYEAIGAEGMRMSVRLILVGDRLYQIICVHPGATDELFKKVTGSFQLL